RWVDASDRNHKPYSGIGRVALAIVGTPPVPVPLLLPFPILPFPAPCPPRASSVLLVNVRTLTGTNERNEE
ncbi:hypothetical protein H0H93_002776, partial [Arthromyces matolae]